MNSAVRLAPPQRWYGHIMYFFFPAATECLSIWSAKFTLIAIKWGRVIHLSVKCGSTLVDITLSNVVDVNVKSKIII